MEVIGNAGSKPRSMKLEHARVSSPLTNRLALCILVATVLTACTKSPASTVQSFYRAVEKGEITEAKSYLSAQILGMLGEGKVSAALSAEHEKIRGCGGIKNVDAKFDGEGEIRSGNVFIEYRGNCTARSEKTKLIKEDGKWKIGPNK